MSDLVRPGQIIGYRKNGLPIHLIAGGSETAPETPPQEPAQDPGQPKGSSRFYSEEDFKAAIEAARQQEKDKLYGRISKDDERSKAMQDELKELKAFQKKAEKQEQDRLKAIEDAQRAKNEAEMSAKDFAEKVRVENEARIAEMRAEQEQERALLKKELEFMSLQNHIQARVSEEQDNIAPELLDFITGDTVEEVEASIERVKAKTQQIVENMRQAGVRQRASMPGVAPASGANSVGPLDAPQNEQISADDIQGMGMGQFAELRKKLGMDRLSTNTGLFS